MSDTPESAEDGQATAHAHATAGMGALGLFGFAMAALGALFQSDQLLATGGFALALGAIFAGTVEALRWL